MSRREQWSLFVVVLTAIGACGAPSEVRESASVASAAVSSGASGVPLSTEIATASVSPPQNVVSQLQAPATYITSSSCSPAATWDVMKAAVERGARVLRGRLELSANETRVVVPRDGDSDQATVMTEAILTITDESSSALVEPLDVWVYGGVSELQTDVYEPSSNVAWAEGGEVLALIADPEGTMPVVAMSLPVVGSEVVLGWGCTNDRGLASERTSEDVRIWDGASADGVRATGVMYGVALTEFLEAIETD